MKLVGIIALFFFNAIDVTYEQQTDTCSRLTRFVNDLGMELTQGPPGKMGARGPVGERGLKGQKGETGETPQCACSEDRFVPLERLTRSLSDRIADMSLTLNRLNSMHSVSENSKVYHCSVGLMDHRIPDSSFTASSTNTHHTPYSARYNFQTLNSDERSGYWGCRYPPRTGEWLQVDLLEPIRVTAVVTQGRPRMDEWISRFSISYGNNTNNLQAIQKDNGDLVFHAGPETVNKFPTPITARYIRLTALRFVTWPVLRLEYLTC